MPFKHKCTIIRDDLEVSLTEVHRLGGPMDAVVFKEVKRNGRMQQVPFWKKGATLETTEAYRLVQMGVAEPADEECEKLACRTPEELNLAKRAYERVSRGIDPKDYDLFDGLVIEGYNPDGSYKPGPNWHKYEEAKRQESEAQEDDEDEGQTAEKEAPRSGHRRR